MLMTGLVISMVMIMTCSTLIAKIMNRYNWVAYLGAGVLAFAAAELISDDLAELFARPWLSDLWSDLPSQAITALTWTFYAAVVCLCLTARRWWPNAERELLLNASDAAGQTLIDEAYEQTELAVAMALQTPEEALSTGANHTTKPFYRRLLHVEQPAELT
jgi:hypothetical protein